MVSLTVEIYTLNGTLIRKKQGNKKETNNKRIDARRRAIVCFLFSLFIFKYDNNRKLSMVKGKTRGMNNDSEEVMSI